MPSGFSLCTAKILRIPIARIQAFKRVVEHLLPAPPTTNTVVCALLWSSITCARAKRQPALSDQTSHLAMAVNGRQRIGGGLSTSENPYFGNAIAYSLAKTSVQDLSDTSNPRALATVCDAIVKSQWPHKINVRHIAEVYNLLDSVEDYRSIFPG
jgi:hypothetical protein